MHENRTSRDLGVRVGYFYHSVHLRLLRYHRQVAHRVMFCEPGVAAATIRYLLVLLGCDQEKGGAAPKEKAERSVGMPEDVWRMYSGAESGLPEEKREPAKRVK